jgi:hypothetical protein
MASRSTLGYLLALPGVSEINSSPFEMAGDEEVSPIPEAGPCGRFRPLRCPVRDQVSVPRPYTAGDAVKHRPTTIRDRLGALRRLLTISRLGVKPLHDRYVRYVEVHRGKNVGVEQDHDSSN